MKPARDTSAAWTRLMLAAPRAPAAEAASADPQSHGELDAKLRLARLLLAQAKPSRRIAQAQLTANAQALYGEAVSAAAAGRLGPATRIVEDALELLRAAAMPPAYAARRSGDEVEAAFATFQQLRERLMPRGAQASDPAQATRAAVLLGASAEGRAPQPLIFHPTRTIPKLES